MDIPTDNKLGWGHAAADGSEMWDAHPAVLSDQAGFKDWLRLLFYPKKFFLYRYIARAKRRERGAHSLREPFRILDVGCGTGGSVIDFKRLFGREVEVVGLDVIKMQTEIAEQKIKQHGVYAEIVWYDGTAMPFADLSFDAIYTSDVLGHVEDVPAWLTELNRVLKGGGVIAMFAESKIGKHALIRRYLAHRGVNLDPHAEFHISLYDKYELKILFENAGLFVQQMYSSFWMKFLAHPDELYPALQAQKGLFFLKLINRILYWIKKKLGIVGLAIAELYGLIEMFTIGRWVESQGYVILAKKPGARDK